MSFISFLFFILSNEKEINITDSFIGKWSIDHLKIDPNGLYEDLSDSYKLIIEDSGDNFIGNLSYTNKLDTIPSTQIKINRNDNLVYSLLYSENGSDEFKEFASSLTFKTGVDDLIQTFGHINSTTSFALNFFSASQIEITLYNTENDIVSFYRLEKQLPPTKPPITTLQIFLPMIPIFIMMYNRMKARNEQIRKAQIAKKQKFASNSDKRD